MKSIEEMISEDYYLPTKFIGKISNFIIKYFNISDLKKSFRIRIATNLIIFSFLAFGIPTIVGFITNDYLFDNIEIILAFVWLAIGGLLIDLFEYSVDDFWVRYEKLSCLGKEEYIRLKEKMNKKIFSRKYLFLSMLAYIIFFSILFDVLRGHGLIVISMVYILLIPASIMWGIVGYLTFFMYYFVKKICYYKINVDPFNPDSFGGLSIIGNLPLRVSALIASGSLYIPYGINRIYYLGLKSPTGIVILIGVLFITLVIASTFFIPLMPVNKIAKKIKTNMLKKCGSQLKELFDKPCKEQNGSTEIYLRTLVAAEHYKEIKNMKVWPFSKAMIFELFGYILLPTFSSIIGLYLQLF